ncbi:MAG: ABC transporter permease [Halanaerobiaceae bacterium]
MVRINVFKLKVQQVLAVAGKNMKIYYTESPILIYGILFPFFLFLAFALGKDVPVGTLVPGLLAISFFFTGSSVGPFITPWETRTKTLERLLTTPGSTAVLILGDILSAFLFSLGISVLVIIVGTLVLGGTVANVYALLGTIFLASLCFAGLGSLFSALPTDKPANVMMLSNLVRLPVIFISGVFVPVGELPEWGQVIARISPVTYVADLTRFAFGQEYFFTLALDFFMLFFFTVLFVFLAVFLHRKTMQKRI